MWCFDVPWRSFWISQTSASVVASETCSVSPIRGRLKNLTGPETWIMTREQRRGILRLAKKFDAVFSVQCILYTTVHSYGGWGCVSNSGTLALNRQRTAGPKYNNSISLLNSQYLISSQEPHQRAASPTSRKYIIPSMKERESITSPHLSAWPS
jgi:hypothetical protein